MLTLVITSLPGALFVATLSFALALPWAGPELALLVGLLVALLLVVSWVFVLPPLFSRRALEKLSLTREPLLEWGWQRAFDGLPSPGKRPNIWVWNSAVPAFLVMTPPFLGPSVVVSRGWLFEKGEDAFRGACRDAKHRLSDPALGARTRNAFLLSWMTGLVHPAFWSAGFLPGSEASSERRLGAASLTWGLLMMVWMRWIIRWTAPRDSFESGPMGRLSVDEMGRTNPQSEVLCQFLALERPAVLGFAQKSILSWLPAHW
jgi:hypothetical protein